jgi:hypothetical protein
MIPLFLLRNWKWLAPSVVALVLAGWLGVVKYELLSLRLEVVAQKAEAARLISERNAEITATVQARAEANRELEIAHAQAQKDIAVAHDDFERALAQRVRASSRISCPAPGSAQTPDPGPSETVATAGLFVSTASLQDVGTLMREADELSATMKQCKAFADAIGK